MKLIVQNLAIEYQDEGSGSSSTPLSGASADKPVLLFLHGWGDSSRTFDNLMPFLTGGQRIIRLDLPGFGGTEAPPRAWALDDYILFVGAFIKKLNIRPRALIGHSFGGRIIIKGNATGRLPAEKIILISPAGISFRNPFRISFFWILAKIGKIILSIPPLSFLIKKSRRKFYQWLGSDYFEAGVLRETFLKIIKEDIIGAAEKINIPTLLIWGEDDIDTPLADGRRLNKLIRGSRLEIIAGADHMVHQEKPREVAQLIINDIASR